MKSRAEVVEQELGVRLPEEYKTFLRTYGIYEYAGGEVYGVTEDMVDLGEIPCVIGATRNAQKICPLPKEYLVVNHTGFEDEMVCLDAKTGRVYLIGQGTSKLIAESFDEWFTRDILDK